MAETTETQDMLGRGGLIPVTAARKKLLDALAGIALPTEHIPLEQGFGRILAAEVTSREDLPAYARSTMDGYAVRSGDTFGASESMPAYLTITGEVRMGQFPDGKVTKGCCQKIPTGGLLPEGADGVVMLEHTVPVDETMIEVVKSVGSGTNLIQRGEDIAEGDIALKKGHRLRPQDIGLLAGLGVETLEVHKKIRMGIFSTGDEIIPHTQNPEPGQIRNINSLALQGLVLEAGGDCTDYGIVQDDHDHFMPLVQKAVQECDIVLFSGGSSVGVRDLGEQVIDELGPPGVLVHGVKLKPGKPVLIGMADKTPVFGLPGHPVSAMVCFEYFVKPAMQHLQGLSTTAIPRPYVLARLGRNINSAAGRLDQIRVRLKKQDSVWLAEPILGKSGSISTLSKADGFFEIEEESQGINIDSIIKVHLYQ